MRRILYSILMCSANLSGFAERACFGFHADSVSLPQGDTAEIRIRATDFDSIVSFQGTLTFDTSAISFVSLGQFGLPGMNAGSFNVSQAQNGWMTFSWMDPDADGYTRPDTQLLFSIRIVLTGNPGSGSPVQFGSSVTPMEVANFTLNVIPFCPDSGWVGINGPSMSRNEPFSPECKLAQDFFKLVSLDSEAGKQLWEGQIIPLNPVQNHIQEVFSGKLSPFEWKSALSDLPPNLYFVSLGPASCRVSYKILKD